MVAGGGGDDSESGGKCYHSHGHGHDHDHGDKNRSLQGIEMHIIADVLQQIGLTIAGGILWYVFTCSKCCSAPRLCIRNADSLIRGLVLGGPSFQSPYT